MSASRPFLLLDRDGTLIEEREYLHDPAEVRLVPGAAATLRLAKDLGWGIAVVTNQSGVGRGMFTMEDVERVHAEIASQLAREEATVDGFYVCPHGPDEGCDCRKPAPGLALRIEEELGANLRHSIVVGDKRSDLDLGRAVGAATVLVSTGYGEQERAEGAYDHLAANLGEVARIVEERARVLAHFEESIRVKAEVRDTQSAAIVRIADLIARSMATGGKLLICGNGGSAADSQHLATEFVVRLSAEFQRPALPAIALTVDTSTLTAGGNDFGFERVFSRQVEALGRPGDVLLAISTGGGSPNVVAAVEEAKARGLVTTALLGGNGGRVLQLVDAAVLVPSTSTQHVQESHIAAYHLLCGLVERRLFA